MPDNQQHKVCKFPFRGGHKGAGRPGPSDPDRAAAPGSVSARPAQAPRRGIAGDILAGIRTLLSGMVPRSHVKPSDWAEGNLIFGAGEPVPGPFRLSGSPYLRDVLDAWELIPGQGLKVVTVVAPQQTGKTLSWLGGLLWSLEHDPGASLVYYTSEDVAKRINSTKMEPLLREIPRFRELLSLPRSHSAEAYRLAENTVYFGGVGSRIASFSARRLIADELDDWLFTAGTDPYKDLTMRSRAYPEALLCAVCSPRGSTSRIWRLFRESSRGYFSLRCLGCGELTIKSNAVAQLKFEQDKDGRLIEESLRLICPKCGRSHIEDEAAEMVTAGGYVHEHPELITTRPGFQWGALASLISPQLRWAPIAEAQLRAGKSGAVSDQIFFDNSIRAVPYRPRVAIGPAEAALRRLAADPPEVKLRLFSADTQATGWYWLVRGYDKEFRSILLDCGMARTLEELTSAFSDSGADMGIIDEGGFSPARVRTWARSMGKVMTYKGNPRMQGAYPFEASKQIPGLIVARENYYRGLLLRQIYVLLPEGPGSWHVPRKLPPQYLEQMSAWHLPENSTHQFDEFEHWVSTGNDHFFDCEKMLFVLRDYITWATAQKLAHEAAARPVIVRRAGA